VKNLLAAEVCELFRRVSVARWGRHCSSWFKQTVSRRSTDKTLRLLQFCFGYCKMYKKFRKI